MSDAPRTEEVWFYQRSDHHADKVVPLDFAQQLERENRQLKDDLSREKEANLSADTLIATARAQRDEIEAELKVCAEALAFEDKVLMSLTIPEWRGMRDEALSQPITQSLLTTTK